METKHTPGPWMATLANMITTENAHMELATVWANPSRHHVQEEEAESNAKLIAAAPELLEALDSFVREFDCKPIDCRYLIDAARAAIAKATE